MCPRMKNEWFVREYSFILSHCFQFALCFLLSEATSQWDLTAVLLLYRSEWQKITDFLLRTISRTDSISKAKPRNIPTSIPKYSWKEWAFSLTWRHMTKFSKIFWLTQHSPPRWSSTFGIYIFDSYTIKFIYNFQN